MDSMDPERMESEYEEIEGSLLGSLSDLSLASMDEEDDSAASTAAATAAAEIYCTREHDWESVSLSGEEGDSGFEILPDSAFAVEAISSSDEEEGNNAGRGSSATPVPVPGVGPALPTRQPVGGGCEVNLMDLVTNPKKQQEKRQRRKERRKRGGAQKQAKPEEGEDEEREEQEQEEEERRTPAPAQVQQKAEETKKPKAKGKGKGKARKHPHDIDSFFLDLEEDDEDAAEEEAEPCVKEGSTEVWWTKQPRAKNPTHQPVRSEAQQVSSSGPRARRSSRRGAGCSAGGSKSPDDLDD